MTHSDRQAKPAKQAGEGRSGDVPRDDWDTHWADIFEASKLNPAGAYRLRLLLQRLEGSIRSGSRLIDIGCGPGYLVSEACKRFPDVEARGVELSEAAVEIARSRVPRAEFLRCDLLRPSNIPQAWLHWADVAVCSEVLEHIDRPEVLLSNARVLLSPGSRVVVTVPAGPISSFDRYIGHRRHYTRRDLEALLRDSGFTVARCDAEGFPAFNIYRLMVIARGRKLVQEATVGRIRESRAARAAASLFNFLFRTNPSTRRWGWQLVAEAVLES
jgi:SAM-dependent methyltransferase